MASPRPRRSAIEVRGREVTNARERDLRWRRRRISGYKRRVIPTSKLARAGEEADLRDPGLMPAVPDPARAESEGHATRMELRWRSLRASGWTLFGYGAAQAIRLGSSMLLTRLLFREAFGLMAIVNTLFQGLVMFSDLGIGPAVVQNARGHDERFLGTAWTLQILRAAALLVFCVAIAVPVARLYGHPELTGLVIAVGGVAMIGGFNSTAMFTLNRKLEQKRLVVIELASQMTGLAVMVAWALARRSVWSLMMGMIASWSVKAWASHRLLAHRDRLSWDPAAARELIAFGRWIFLSSALAFCGGRLDSLILGKVLSVQDLGLYSIGNNLARLPLELVLALASAVLFPLFSESARGNPEAFKRTLYRSRTAVLLPAVALALGLAIGGETVIRLIYDPRYHAAGWMTRVLAAGQIAGCIGALSGAALLAVGDSFLAMALEAVRALLLIGGMALGGHLYGPTGVIVAVAAVGPLSYPFCAAALARRQLWQPKLDIPLLVLGYAAVAAALLLR